ncbi:MAG: pitrilysin family protein, partial [Myxococcota bacterium]
MSASPVHCEVLPNGLTVLLRETRLAPVCEFQIWACVGSADEQPAERGLAHFHEHMLFKGTERRGVGEVAAEVEGAGGRINAFTTYDVTCYHATLPADHLATGIDVLSDAVLHSTFDPVEIQREIEVVIEEIRRSDDSPSSVLGNEAFAGAFREHPYRFPILGSRESVASFDQERVRAFYEGWYTPDNLVVVAAGDLDVTATLEAVRERFGSLPRGKKRRQRPREARQQSTRAIVLERPFERVKLEMLAPNVGLADADAPYLDLAAYLLGGCDSSRLVERVKEGENLADRIDAWSYTPVDPGVFAIDVDTDSARVEDVIAASVRECTRLAEQPVREEELEKARLNFLAMEHFERESVSGMASKLGSFHTTAGHHEAETRYLEAIRNARAEDLMRVSRSYLAPEALTVAVLLPEGAGGTLDEAAVQRAVARGAEHTRRAFSAPRAQTTAPIFDYELACGARLHVLPRREVPVVAARAAFRGGLLAEDAGSSGLSAFVSSMWMRGTRKHSAAGFAAAVEGRAAEIDSFSGRSSLGLSLETPSASLDPALDLFAEVLLEPAFDAREIERERQDTLAAIERREDNLAQRCFQLFAQQLYLEHPYRMPTLGSAEVIRELDADSIAAHHARLAVASNLVIAVAGDVDPDAVAHTLSSSLADLNPGPYEALEPANEAAPQEIRRAEIRKAREQAHLVIGFPGLRVDDEDRFALEVISQLLAGQGGRLFLELRDRRGLAYSVNASGMEGVAPGWFAAYIATSPER